MVANNIEKKMLIIFRVILYAPFEGHAVHRRLPANSVNRSEAVVQSWLIDP